MILKWAKSRGMQITTISKFLNLTAVFTQSKAHLSDGINRECTFQIQTSNSLSILAQGFLYISRFLSKFNYLDFISVKYSNQLMALSEFANKICN